MLFIFNTLSGSSAVNTEPRKRATVKTQLVVKKYFFKDRSYRRNVYADGNNLERRAENVRKEELASP